ncbi:X-Pro dipeptidyl-peptidase (S15 family) [Filimonas lacunae]|uniref:X-Pro dipeptidyl-peptidase (S15 family) n=2 Tax=Filimonas lacunae TaxID=477680 RepID=A0A1N7KQG2_9BACT|nr:X-Pro dipeptidyl-peptidase (S15 family) [Filimonas lacunae]
MCLWFGSSFAQTGGSFDVQPQRPTGGSTITVTYHPDSVLRKSAAVKGIMYIYDTLYRWHTYDLPMKKQNDTAWKGEYALPGDAGFIAWRFTDGDYYDNNNDMGYFCMINSVHGGNAGGAEAGYGLLRSPSYGFGVPGYFKNYSISDTATYMWLSNEILRHSAVARFPLVMPYLVANMRFKGAEKGINTAGLAAAYLAKNINGEESRLVKLLLIHQIYLKDSVVIDSIKQALQQQFPNGALARLKAYQAIYADRNPDKQLELAVAFVRAYPFNEAQEEVNQLLGIDYDKAYRSLFAIAIARQKTELVMEFLPGAPLIRLAEVYYKSVEIPYADWKSVSAENIAPMAAAIMGRLQYLKTHQPAAFWYYSPSEWLAYIDKMFKSDYVTQAEIELENGHVKEALQLVETAQREYQYSRTILNETQVRVLEKTGNTKQMREVLEKSIRLNQTSGYMINLLKKQYLATHAKATSAMVDSYLESLKDEHTMELMREEIKKDLRKEKAADFTLQERNAGMAGLSSCKGKIVVLDFWATWCAPCKAGMAGMKMVADKYSKDTNVVFFFVDTQERDPEYKQKVNTFLQQMHYDNFRILFDNGEETYAKYAKQIHTSGIPFKIVINQQGILNFANVGYKGSPTGLADEISTMIEMARKEGEVPPAADTTRWQGQTGTRRILLKTTGTETGAKAWIDAPEQFVNGQAVTSFTVAGDSIIAEGPSYVGTIRGKLSPDKKTITCALYIKDAVKPVVMQQVLHLQPVHLPQQPTAPFTYTSENVSYYNADSSIRFGATLTMPDSGAQFPAVVILSGTGQQDRNGTMAGHQTFAVIADYLSRHGIAVLRVDDRGVNETTGNYTSTTTAQFAEDALAGIAFLGGNAKINSHKIGLVGHSEGGAAACIAASRSAKVAFVISLSGIGILGLDALLLQNKAIVEKAPITAENKLRFNKANQTFLPVAYKYANDSSLEKQLRAAYAQWKIEDSVYVSGIADKKLTDHFFYPFESYVMQATGPWYRGFISYNPAKVFGAIKVPVLAMNGDKDIISLANENIQGFQKYIKRRWLQTWIVPGVNHLYQHCITCTTQEYAELSETFAPEVLEKMGRFILAVK